jgi:hypothetical protein
MHLLEKSLSFLRRKQPEIAINSNESGFLLVSATVMIMIVVALLSSASFVATRQSRFDSNFTAGERLGQLAVMAHYYAQREHYGPAAVNLDGAGNLFRAGFLVPPDGFKFASVKDTNFEIEVVGRNASPVNNSVPAAVKAASAYIHVRVRPKNGGTRNATDNVALFAGANSQGMARIGLVQLPGSDLCDGATTAVRWGAESSSCLNTSQVAAMFVDAQPGDIIVPAWETALAKNTSNAMYRYKQPERSDLNAMTTALKMGGFSIQAVGQDGDLDSGINTENLTAAGTSQLGNDPTDFMVVRQGSTATFSAPIITNGEFNVSDASAGPTATNMNVSGSVEFTSADINIAQTLEGSTGLVVNSANPIGVPILKNETTLNVAAYTSGGVAAIAVDKIDAASTITGMEATAPNSRLAISGDLNAENAVLRSGPSKNLDFYAGQMTTHNATTIANKSGDPLNWTVGSLESKSGARLTVPQLQLIDCKSTQKACPDSITDPPDQGGF